MLRESEIRAADLVCCFGDELLGLRRFLRRKQKTNDVFVQLLFVALVWLIIVKANGGPNLLRPALAVGQRRRFERCLRRPDAVRVEEERIAEACMQLLRLAARPLTCAQPRPGRPPP